MESGNGCVGALCLCGGDGREPLQPVQPFERNAKGGRDMNGKITRPVMGRVRERLEESQR